MKLLLIHQAFITPGEAGGTRHYELGKFLLSRGHDMTVVASDVSYLSGELLVARQRLLTRQDVGGLNVLRAYTVPSMHRSFVWRVVSFLSFMATSAWAGLRAGPVDVVMGTSPPLFQLISAWLVARLRRKPLLVEIRDLWPEFAIAVGVLRNPILIWLARRLEHFMYRAATHLVVNSPAYRDYLIDHGVARDKITLIPNGVDPDMFCPEDDGAAVRNKWGLQHKFVATYAGALGMSNDIPTILRAADRLRDRTDIHFLLVGDGKDGPKLRQTAAEMDLANVTFTGPCEKSQMPQVFAASDACIATLLDIAMYRMTYPNKVFDYMAAGRPTLLAIDGVIRQVVEAADGGEFVPPGSDAALAAATAGLCDDRQRAQQMGRSARAYVVEHFNRRKHADQFVQLLEGFAASGQEPPAADGRSDIPGRSGIAESADPTLNPSFAKKR